MMTLDFDKMGEKVYSPVQKTQKDLKIDISVERKIYYSGEEL